MEEQVKEKVKEIEFEPSRLFDSFITVGRDLIVRPRIFFRGMPRRGGISSSFFYLAICSFLASLLLANILKGDFRLFLLLFVANITSSFTESLVLHVLAARFCKTNAGFAVTFRIVAYSSLTYIFSCVQVLAIFCYCYRLYLIMAGLQEAHGLKPRQAALTVMVILAITLLFIGMMFASPDIWEQGLKLMEPQAVES